MRFTTTLALSLALCLPALAQVAKKPAQPAKPQIEVCFVLDTTGSMGGLIKGAKMKIWSIANEMATAKPTPDIKFGLIGYRDRREAYVTKVYDLTDDIDAIYDHLQKFQAQGGGDTPESVNQALNEAVTKMSWSKSRDVLKIIFVVGDAPPHMDYKEDVKYADSCVLAMKKDLIINTIQCGSMAQTTPVWQDIARKSEGQFVQIGQTGNMVAIATPFDKDIAKLNRDLGGTVIAYGSARYRSGVAKKLATAESAPAPASADRLALLSKSGKVVTGKGDLLKDLDDESVELEDVKEEELPDELKKVAPAKRKEYIAGKSRERKAIQEKLGKLLKQRDDFLKAEMKKRSGKRDAFDAQVATMIRKQAKRKGISYDDVEKKSK